MPLSIPPLPPATPLSITSVVALVIPSGVCDPVETSEPSYCFPVFIRFVLLPPLLLRPADEPPLLEADELLLPLADDDAPLLEEDELLPPVLDPPRFAEDAPPLPLEALRPPPEDLDAPFDELPLRFDDPLLLAPLFVALPRLEDDPLLLEDDPLLEAELFEDELLEEDPPLDEVLDAPLLAPPRLPELLLEPRDGPLLRDAPFDELPRLDDFEEALLAPLLEDLAAPFLGAAFLADDFFAATFDELPLPEDEPPLEVEPPRPDDFDAPFFAAPFDEDRPPDDLLPPFFAAALLVDFAIVDLI